MPRQIIRRKRSSLRRDPANVRGDLGAEADAIALWRSYVKLPAHPFVIKLPDLIVDGNRRHWGGELDGDRDHEVDCIVVEGSLTDEEVRFLQISTSLHRADTSLYDKCRFMIGFRDANPGKTLKALAEELSVDTTMPTKWLTFEKCIPEVQEHIKAGKIGLRDMVAIGVLKPEEQPTFLAAKLGGVSAEELGRQSRKRRAEANKPAVTTSKLVCKLVGGAKVTIADDDLSLESTVELLLDLVKQMKKASGQGLDIRTFAAVLADVAANN